MIDESGQTPEESNEAGGAEWADAYRKTAHNRERIAEARTCYVGKEIY